MNIVFIAPPAAGKGAQSGMISKEYNIPHVSIGDLLRNVDDDVIRKQLSLGEFVDNDVIEKLLTERLSKDDCKNGYVLDGFPRNNSQIEIYERIKNISNNKNNVVIVLDIPREVGERRICGRFVCPKCGSVYNELISESKPKVDGIITGGGTEEFDFGAWAKGLGKKIWAAPQQIFDAVSKAVGKK